MTGTITVVTGTNTGVGKTVATAALAARALASGERVVVVKPAQTGSVADDGGPGDSDAREVARLAGCATQEWTTLPEPLAPDTAARRAGVAIPPVGEYADRILDLARDYDRVIVEGAGGVLVRLDADGGTLIDIAAKTDAEVVVVCGAGLGTLNHTELTVAALRSRAIEPVGLIIGAWPTDPGLAERCNVVDLPEHTGVPLVAILPAGAGGREREEFLAAARGWWLI